MNLIKDLALEYGRTFSLWPENDRRRAAAYLYESADGDDRIAEACEAWVSQTRQAITLGLVLEHPATRQQVLGRGIDACLMAYAGLLIQHRLDIDYDNWNSEEL